jgi:hypothetical protein
VAFLGDGAIVAAHRQALMGAEFAALGIAFIGTALASLSDRRPSLGAVAVCGLGIEFATLGLTPLTEQHALFSLVLTGVGLAMVVDGIALAANSRPLNFIAVITTGLVGIGIGAALLADRQPLTGGAVILLGVSVIGSGAALAGRYRLGFAAVTASGVAAVVTGIAWHPEHRALIVIMVIAGGVANTWLGFMEMRNLHRTAGSVADEPPTLRAVGADRGQVQFLSSPDRPTA